MNKLQLSRTIRTVPFVIVIYLAVAAFMWPFYNLDPYKLNVWQMSGVFTLWLAAMLVLFWAFGNIINVWISKP